MADINQTPELTQQDKTAVQVVQELIALHTTRREASERLIRKNSGDDVSLYKKALSDSEDAIEDLMSELSEFGDAVMAEVNREDSYQRHWKQTLADIDHTDACILRKRFEEMEQLLAQRYRDELTAGGHLPDSIKSLLSRKTF